MWHHVCRFLRRCERPPDGDLKLAAGPRDAWWHTLNVSTRSPFVSRHLCAMKVARQPLSPADHQTTRPPDCPQLLGEVFDRSGWCLTFSLALFFVFFSSLPSRSFLSLFAPVSPRVDRSRPLWPLRVLSASQHPPALCDACACCLFPLFLGKCLTGGPAECAAVTCGG